jgi:cyanophycinase
MKRVLLLVAVCCSLVSQAQKGSLFIIGGGNRSDSLMAKMVQTADLGVRDYVVVLPMASEQPEAGFALIKEQIAKHSSAAILNFDFRSENAVNQKWIDSLSGAKLIYILGGDQNRFMKAVLNTGIYRAIHQAYLQGATVAGTSAGAAVMSRYMITGRQLQDTAYRETFDKLWANNIEFAEGLALTDIIIDQHFIKRARYSRLISAIAAKPDHICLGIDEGTAIIVKGKKAVVAGESQVIKIASPNGVQIVKSKLLRVPDLNMGVYTAGDMISLNR